MNITNFDVYATLDYIYHPRVNYKQNMWMGDGDQRISRMAILIEESLEKRFLVTQRLGL